MTMRELVDQLLAIEKAAAERRVEDALALARSLRLELERML
jgi:hypothetical protein